MIFQHTWQQVLDGTKTQTRRIQHPLDFGQYHRALVPIEWVARKKSAHYSGPGRTVYAVGHTYAVQPGRGQKAVGRIRITAIRRQDVREISDDDVKAEGFETRADFLRLWEQMHGAQYEAWALTFEVVK